MKVGFLLLAVVVTLSQEINDNKKTRDEHEDTGQKENQDGVIDDCIELSNEEIRDDHEGQEEKQDGVTDYCKKLSNEETRDDLEGQDEKQDGVIDNHNELSNEETRDDLEGQEEKQDGVVDNHNELSNEETRDDLEGQEEKQDGKQEIKSNKDHKQNIIEPEEAKFKKGAELVSNLRFEDKARGYEMLKEAAAMRNSKAKYLLAYGYLYGNVLQRNFTKSFELFTELANKGFASGQQGLGFMYSTGIGTNSSQAKAILYYTFGALGGDPHAQMSMGYRSLHGVATSKSCETALSYYRKVASKVADESSVFAGGHSVQKIRLQDDEDEPSTVFAGVTEDELEHYREVFADAGAQLSLGLYYLFGLGGVERNLPQALELLQRADSPAANALIGRIYAEGSPPDIPQNNETAIKYFKKAIDLKSGEGYTGLGIMYFKGMGVERDYSTAMEYFQKAADKGSHEANLYIGLGYLFGLGKVKNPSRALSSLKASAQGGHILAIYYLAEIYAKGLTGRRNCDQAVELYKAVSERGKWSKLLREAHKTYLSGDIESALIMYLHLAEIGIEVAQSNAAYIINEGETDMIDKNDSLKIALILWSRSATQGYGVARVKLGDCYYYGYGTEPNMELAVEQYRMASDKMAISQAMFNLGYMYEQGIGLQQDYHLAKRYYDLAAQTSTEAAVPVNLALMKLNIHFYYQYILEYISSYEELDKLLNILHSSLGEQWDIYLTALLCIVLAIVIRWHRR